MPIRWGEMDAMGHLNNTVYFRSAEGGAKVVWVDFPSEKSAPLLDWVRALLPEPEA